MDSCCNPSQKAFIRQGIIADVRLDGRQNSQLKKSHVTVGVLHQAQGSALLNATAENLTVYASVKLQVIRRETGRLPEASIAVESIKDNDREGYSKDSDQDIHLALLEENLRTTYIAHLNHSVFSIAASQQYTLKPYIDVFLMSYPHLSQLDLIVQCIKAAIVDLRIPQFVVTRNEITAEEDLQVTEDTLPYSDASPLPDVFLVGEVEGNLVCDLTQEEFECMDSLFLFSMRNEQILNFRQLSGTISPELLLKVTKFAARVSQTRKAIDTQK